MPLINNNQQIIFTRSRRYNKYLILLVNGKINFIFDRYTVLPCFITSPEKLQNKKKMESCLSVERELDKVLTKFTGLHDHSTNTIEDFISSIENIRRELAEGSYSSKNLTFIFPAKSQNSINVTVV